MSKKVKSKGKTVICTADGVKVVDARELAGIEKYIKLGYADEMPPAKLDGLKKFTRTKFCRLIFDIQRLAQWEPFSRGNGLFTEGVDWTLSIPEMDAQLYRAYDFTPAMITFAEERYSYDDAVHDGQD